MFGHWKDTAVMLKGEAVRSFTLMFLQMWNLTEPEPLFDPDHDEMETMVICNEDGSYTQIYKAEGL